MTLRLNERDRRILDAMKDGACIPTTARLLDIPSRSVYNNVTKLCSMGYLTKIPGTESPAMYEKGPRYIEEMKARQSKEASDSANCAVVGTNRGPSPSEYCTHLHPTFSVPDVQPGVWNGDVCPAGYVEMHLNGGMSVTIEEVGTFDDPKLPGIGYVGYWKKPYRNNGSTNYPGEIKVDGQLVSFNYRVGDKGSKTFTIRPKRVFVDPSVYRNKDEAAELFKWRAMKVVSVLATLGWRLTDPKINGQSDVEVAIRNHPLSHFIPQTADTEGCDLFVDGSPGCPEVEMSHIEDWEKVQIFARLPTHVKEAKAMAKEADEKASEAHGRLDAVESIIGRMVEVQEKTTNSIVRNAENIARIAGFDADVADMVMRSRAETYVPPNSMEARIRMVGYQ